MDFRDLVRLTTKAKLTYGEFRATGLPAVIISLSGLVLASGVARAIASSAASLPETFREGRAMIEAGKARKGTFGPEVVRRLDDR
jgi:hypothetical protein